MQTEKSFFVFVVDAENKAALRDVKMGEWVGPDWIVLSGLTHGDRVVVDNLLKVRPGATVTPKVASATPGGDGKPPAADAASPPAK
jgi:membrane fusion protein (multidrug efflux system)